MREAGEFLQKLESDIAKLKIQLEKLRSAKPVDEMTVLASIHCALINFKGG